MVSLKTVKSGTDLLHKLSTGKDHTDIAQDPGEVTMQTGDSRAQEGSAAGGNQHHVTGQGRFKSVQ
jgi:hypothetical protein